MTANPLDGFVVDRSQIEFIGQDLQRPECILAERDGTLWAADARGGVVRIDPTARSSSSLQKRPRQTPRPPTTLRSHRGTLPNGLAFDRDGNFLIANFGTDRFELMTRDGVTRALIDSIDGNRSARPILSPATAATAVAHSDDANEAWTRHVET